MKTNLTTKSYIVGFALSLLLTLTAYSVVINHLLNSWMLIATVLMLALVQLLVQLLFFLHLGQESQPRWKLAVFISTFSIVLLIIIASLWIMNHLNYNMTSQQINEYVQSQDGM